MTTSVEAPGAASSLRLIASTVKQSYPQSALLNNHSQPNSPRRLHLSPDGTVLLAHSEDLHLRSFVIPRDLLDSPQILPLNPYSQSSPLNSHAQAFPPYFSLSDPTTTHVLLSSPDLPLRLTNALDLSYLHATYPLIHAPTEAFLAPHSLLFSREGTRFIAGSKSRLSIFDLTRNGEGPVLDLATGRARGPRTAGTGLNGYVTALDTCNETGILAAGSTSGEVALYDAEGAGEEVVSFTLGQAGSGNGISQLAWAGAGRYLLVAQRQSDGVSVWDVRTCRRLNWLKGRRGDLAMRMGFDVVVGADGIDVWAGGVDGMVRTWKDVLNRAGTVEHCTELQLSSDAVTSTLLHPWSHSVMITASGCRKGAAWEDYQLDALRGNSPSDDLCETGIKAWLI